MYKDIYNTFECSNIPYSYPFHFQGDGDKFDYMVGNIPTYEMDYGDTVKIPFCIDEEFINYTILLTLYNFRYESIYKKEYVADEYNKIYFDLDCDASKKLLKKGLYFIQLQAVQHKLLDNEEDIEDGSYLTVCTILPNSDCSIFVK